MIVVPRRACLPFAMAAASPVPCCSFVRNSSPIRAVASADAPAPIRPRTAGQPTAGEQRGHLQVLPLLSFSTEEGDRPPCSRLPATRPMPRSAPAPAKRSEASLSGGRSARGLSHQQHSGPGHDGALDPVPDVGHQADLFRLVRVLHVMSHRGSLNRGPLRSLPSLQRAARVQSSTEQPARRAGAGEEPAR
jgi:hypothetical protein